jgi:hypothetical protein
MLSSTPRKREYSVGFPKSDGIAPRSASDAITATFSL